MSRPTFQNVLTPLVTGMYSLQIRAVQHSSWQWHGCRQLSQPWRWQQTGHIAVHV